MNIFVKSAIYLTGFGALSWVLLEVTTPSQEKVNEIKRRQSTELEESKSQKALFLKTLKEASEGKDPLYLKKKKSE